MPVKLTNLATSTLAGAINSSVTSLAISSGDVDKFPTLAPGEWFPLVVVDNAGNREIMKVTERTGATLTVVRGQEGTAALSFSSGSICELRTTAAALSELSLASGARAIKQDAGTNDESIATTSFVQDAINALKAGVSSALDTLSEIAAYITSATTGIPSRMRKLGPGAALPTSDEGPIWHDDYRSVMTWQSFTANGASYAGYASSNLGCPVFDGQSAARPGHLKLNGASYSKTTYAALWHWALHSGNVVALGSWTARAFVFADNGDGTFKVPDLRATFPRAWDDGAGVNAGRSFGSYEASQNLSHTHTGTTSTDGNHTHANGSYNQLLRNDGSGTGSAGSVDTTPGEPFVNASATMVTAGAHSHTVTTAASGGSEARPISTALLAVIKF